MEEPRDYLLLIATGIYALDAIILMAIAIATWILWKSLLTFRQVRVDWWEKYMEIHANSYLSISDFLKVGPPPELLLKEGPIQALDTPRPRVKGHRFPVPVSRPLHLNWPEYQEEDDDSTTMTSSTRSGTRTARKDENDNEV